MAKMREIDPIYPIHPGVVEKLALSNLLDRVVPEMMADTDCEVRRQGQALSRLKTELNETKEVDKVFYLTLIEMMDQKERTKDVRYAIFKATKRCYVVVEKIDSGNYNFSQALNRPFADDNVLSLIRYKPLTKNLNLFEATVIYAHLMEGEAIPPLFEDKMLGDKD